MLDILKLNVNAGAAQMCCGRDDNVVFWAFFFCFTMSFLEMLQCHLVDVCVVSLVFICWHWSVRQMSVLEGAFRLCGKWGP